MKSPLKNADCWPFSIAQSRRYTLEESGVVVPRITVVTPSFNQGEFIERTIRSILGQGYPNIEYIIMDGGSSDDSVSIIEYYDSEITYWESRKDEGQSDAINRGLNMATGEIIAWVNSDDYLLPNALWHVAEVWLTQADPHWISGTCEFYDDAGNHCYDWEPNPATSLGQALSQGVGVPQTSSFWSRSLWQDVGGLNESLHYCMDEDLWIKFFVKGIRPIIVPENLAVRWMQRDSKTASMLPFFARDFANLVKSYKRQVPVEEEGQWKNGTAITSVRWGIQAWQSIARGNFRGAVVYIFSGCRLSVPHTVWGVLRGLGAAIKRLKPFQ
ncbi:glycosyltransferase family 2 protein [Pseudomonadota bacterium]